MPKVPPQGAIYYPGAPPSTLMAAENTVCFNTASNNAQYIMKGGVWTLVGSGSGGSGTDLTRPIIGVQTVASLPAAAAGNKGMRSTVSDSNATTTAGIGAVVAAGGANCNPVYSDGAAWRIG